MRIGNPMNAEGSALLAGIAAVFDGSAVGSGFTTVANGSNVVIEAVSPDVLAIGVDLSAVTNAVDGKVARPAGNGSYGQVLATNGDGTTRWVDKGAETFPWSGITGRTELIDALPSAVGQNGQVLRVRQDGGVEWAGFDSSVERNSINAPSGSAVYVMMAGHAANGLHVPAIGEEGQVLVKTEHGAAFRTLPVDAELSSDSDNPVRNREIWSSIDAIWSAIDDLRRQP